MGFQEASTNLGGILMEIRLEDKYKNWEEECRQRFETLKHNEEELNRIFINIYGLQDELSPEVENKDVTVRLADREREIKSLISYFVGLESANRYSSVLSFLCSVTAKM